MTGTKMIASIKLITSYKVDASEEDKCLTYTMIDLYKGYHIPSRRTVVNICVMLTSQQQRHRVKGRKAFGILNAKCQTKINKVEEPSETSSVNFNIADSDDETDDTQSYSSEYEFSSEYQYNIERPKLINNFKLYDMLSTERLRAQGITEEFTNI